MKSENENKKGLWTEEEDKILMDHIKVHGKGKWNRIARETGQFVWFLFILCSYIQSYYL